MSVSTGVYGVMGAAIDAGAIFGLTGTPETITCNESDGFQITCNLYVDRDGDLRKRHENYGSFVTTDFGGYANGDDPVTGFGDDYHVRVTHTAGGDIYASGSGLGTWLALTSDRSWQFQETRGGPDSNTTTQYTVAFSDDGGTTTLDSFVLSFNLSWDSP